MISSNVTSSKLTPTIEDDNEIKEIFAESQSDETTDKAAAAVQGCFQNLPTKVADSKPRAKLIRSLSKTFNPKQKQSPEIANSSPAANCFKSDEEEIDFLSDLSNTDLYEFLKSHRLPNQHVFYAAIKERFNDFFQFCLYKTITSFSKKYSDAFKEAASAIYNINLATHNKSGRKTAPLNSTSIIDNPVVKNFGVLKNFLPWEENITELDLSQLPLIYPAILPKLATLFPHVHTITLSFKNSFFPFNLHVAKSFAQFTQLKTLTLHVNNHFTPDFFSCLPRTIQKLHLSGEDLSDNMAAEAFKQLCFLEELTISNTYIDGSCFREPCASLQKLFLSRCAHIDEPFLVTGLTMMPKLQELSLEHVNKITGTLLNSAPQSLTKLSITKCPRLDDEELPGLARLIHLQELKISGPIILGEFLKYVPVSLTLLDCSHCSNLSDLFLHSLERLTSLIELDLSDTSITSSGLRKSPESLLSFNVSGCAELDDDNLDQFLMGANKLTHLNLSETAIKGTCLQYVPESLITLSCSGCRKLTDPLLIEGLKRANKLKSLNVSYTRLHGDFLQFAPQTLTDLDCQKCTSLNLQKTNFEESLKKMEQLRTLDISSCHKSISLAHLFWRLPQSLSKLICHGYPLHDVRQTAAMATITRPELTFEASQSRFEFVFENDDDEKKSSATIDLEELIASLDVKEISEEKDCSNKGNE